MKITKKMIILLIMIMGFLMLGMPSVDAKELPTTGNYVSTSYKKLKVGEDYKVTYGMYGQLKNLFCAEHGQRMWSVGRDYKVIAHFKIINSTSWEINSKGEKIKGSKLSTANKKFSKDYNKKLATGITTLKGNQQKYFIWGYLKTWIKHVGAKSEHVPSNFATQYQPGNYGDILEKVEDDILDSAELDQDELNDATDYNKITYLTVKIGNTEYERVGPFKISGIPKDGLKSMRVQNQDGKEISNAKIAQYKDGQIKEVKASEIKSNKNFYICLPKDIYITKIKAIASAKKFVPTGDSGVEADIYLLKCHDYTWQNLVVTDGEPFDTLTQLQEVPLELKTISMPGDLTIIKTGDGSTLPGATFAIFKYVKNDNGDWYKKGDTYTQNVNEATDKSTKYRRAYLCSQGPNKPYLYEQVGMNGTVKGDPNYHFTTGLDGKITLHDLQPGEYFATELKAPQGYKKIDTFFKLGQVKSLETLTKQVDNQPETTNLDLTKVDANNQELVLEGVGFKFKHPTKGWLKKDKDAQGNAQYTNNESEAKTWKTDANGKIHLEGIEVGTWEYKEDPDTVPEGYSIGTGTGNFQLRSTATNSVTITNKQEFVKLSGFVWVDRAGVKSGDGKDRNDLFKTGPQPDERDLLFDGITVKLKDKRNGSTVDQKVTSQLNRYTETGHNGHGEYLFENVKIDELENYYIEFTYDGLNYTNVVPHLDYINNGSKATESEQDRTTLNNKFSRIEGKTENTGIAKAKGKDGQETALSYEIKQDKDGQKAILNNDGECTEYDSYIVQNKLGDFGITAHTNATNYSIKANFVPGQSEIKYINLGLKDRDRPDISLGKDLENIRLSINGYQHVYEYHQYLSHPLKEEADDAFNVGVRYKNQHTESYKRAIYKADYEYVNEQNKKQELEVYVTYKLEMSQSNPNLKAQINSINDYFDAFYTLERVGTEIDKNKNVGGTIITQRDNNGVLTGGIKEDRYGDGKKYKKVTIPCDMLIDQAQISKDLYVQFKLSREGVLEILGDKKEGEEANDNQLLDNVAEINSYSIFDATGKAYAGVDKDSNPGNCNPLEKDETKREDDTDSSAPIKLEVANARVMTGKVFIDHHEVKNKENPNGVMTGIIRQGNGKYDDGKEESVNGVTVELRDSTTGKIVQVYNPNSKDDNDKWMDARVTTGSGKDKDGKAIDTGDFYISNYIPGQYVVTYTWGGQTYTLNGQPEEITVQNYKGTVYVDQKRYEDNKNNKKWWHVKQTDPVNGTKEASERLTDAIDNYNTDQEAPKGSRIQIDEELKNLNKDVTLQNRLRKQMESTTLPMEIGVEYDTTYSASKGDKYVYKIDNIDFGIIERPKQDLLLTKRVKSMKVTLANGQVIANLTVKENGEITGEKNGVTYMKPNNNLEPKNGFIRLELDNELIQGTKLEVEYEIAVKNNSEKDFVNEVFYKFGTDYTNPVTITPTGMIDYLDKNWSFDSQNGENKKWQVMKVDDEFKKLVIDDVHDSNKNKVTTIGQKLLLYTNQLAGEKLATGEHREITFNVSKILTTTDEIELNNEVEEVTATKTGGAMIQSTLGNYVPGSGPTESDDSMAETTIVTPATGDNRDYILPIIIGATALVVLGVGVVIIKKKVI